MQEFGDFANIDIEKLLKGMDDQIARLEKFQRGAERLRGPGRGRGRPGHGGVRPDRPARAEPAPQGHAAGVGRAGRPDQGRAGRGRGRLPGEVHRDGRARRSASGATP
ncbi:hypothetical protein ACFSTC_49980 [Nonomuraea ferruginea]